MRNAMPPIHEEVTALKEHLQHEHDGRQKPRLQMLYLLASGQTHTRQDVARLLGVHRNTVSRWLALYAVGGLAALRATHPPAGKPVSLAPVVLASLEQALRRPAGFASYEALCQWCGRPTGWRSSTRRCTPWCARVSKLSLRWPAPATQKNPDAIATFQTTCRGHLQQAIPSANRRPIRVFSQDESRCGLLTVRRRRLTARGVQPVGAVQHTFEWFYVCKRSPL